MGREAITLEGNTTLLGGAINIADPLKKDTKSIKEDDKRTLAVTAVNKKGDGVDPASEKTVKLAKV